MGIKSENRIIKRPYFWIALLFLLQPFYSSAQTFPVCHFTLRDGLPDMSIRAIFKDSRGKMWIGTDAGLCSFNGKSYRIYNASEGMTAGRIWAITEDNEGNMWFGTYGDGIYKYDGEKFKQYTKKDGLADDWVRVLCWSEKYRCIVVGGSEGISMIKNDTVQSFPENLAEKTSFTLATGITDAGDFLYITTYGKDNPYRFYPGERKLISVDDDNRYPHNSFSVYITTKGDTVFSYNHEGIKILQKNRTSETFGNMGQIFGITEDKEGNIWMASWSTTNRTMVDGVFRYDGKNIQNYKEAFGITDKEIWTVFYDKEQDILWVGTSNEGLFQIPFSGFTYFPSSFFHLKENRINRVFADSGNNVWISGNRNLVKLQPDLGFSEISNLSTLATFKHFWSPTIRDRIHPDFSYRIEPAGFTNKQMEEYVKKTEFKYGDAVEAGEGKFVFVNHLGAFLFNNRDNSLKYQNLEGYDGNVLVFGDTILFAGSITYFFSDFHSRNVQESVGINFMRKGSQSFTKSGDPKDVSRVYRFNNQTWYTSTTSGLWMSQGTELINFNQSDSTISSNLNDVCFDKKGRIIFGSNTGEICIAKFANRKLTIDFRLNSKNGLQGNRVSWLVVDQSNNLWAGTNSGLNFIPLDSLYKNGQAYIRFLDEEDGYLGQTSKRAVIDSLGNLWIGAEDQLIQFDTHSFLSSKTAEQGKFFLTAIEINNVQVDSQYTNDFNYWTGTPNSGIRLKYFENNLVFYFGKLNFRNPDKDMFRYKLSGFNDTWTIWSESPKAVFTNLKPGKYILNLESTNLSDPFKVVSLDYSFSIQHPWWGIWYLQLAALIFVIGFSFFIIQRFYENKRRKQLAKAEIENRIVKLEMQALQAQMNPHFIFNCINGIQSFVLADKMDEVLGYLSDFSKVVRSSLENATQPMVSLDQEIEFLKSYLRLEQMRFPEMFDFHIATNCISSTVVKIPPMLIQPFVENSIRHGFMKLKRKGLLNIEFNEDGENVIKCTVADNGIGRKKNNQNNEAVKSQDRPHSTNITESRFRLFNTVGNSEKYRIVYTDLFDNGKPAGLIVELYLPKRLQKF